ncbi:MAG: tRNA (adenosine(37)-N6)-threonylcarbamoyltransferase complex ATPase subunit type 1 TsaE [Ruminococcaceae bacterium]|nr:tRNA (adenosine(37)-N6)-threonylcarbamoyltransferase complex ATPase subunit type 1 TsaE [Oscillospiraceae bacterium]
MLKEYYSNSYEDTFNIASDFAKTLKKGDIITFDGDLGAGKTAFVSGLAKGLGISDIVQSPTFTIVNEYRSGKIPLFHFDVYRICDSEEMYDIGFDEYLFGEGICAIEWAGNISELFDMSHYEITIYKDLDISDDFRKIVITRRNS